MPMVWRILINVGINAVLVAVMMFAELMIESIADDQRRRQQGQNTRR